MARTDAAQAGLLTTMHDCILCHNLSMIQSPQYFDMISDLVCRPMQSIKDMYNEIHDQADANIMRLVRGLP